MNLTTSIKQLEKKLGKDYTILCYQVYKDNHCISHLLEKETKHPIIKEWQKRYHILDIIKKINQEKESTLSLLNKQHTISKLSEIEGIFNELATQYRGYEFLLHYHSLNDTEMIISVDSRLNVLRKLIIKLKKDYSYLISEDFYLSVLRELKGTQSSNNTTYIDFKYNLISLIKYYLKVIETENIKLTDESMKQLISVCAVDTITKHSKIIVLSETQIKAYLDHLIF